MTIRRFLAFELAALLAWNSTATRPTALGVAVEADRVHLNTGTVSAGTTVYDGDRFSTERGGMLLLRGEGAMLELPEESVLSVRSRADGTPGPKAELSEGSVIFRAEGTTRLEIIAREACIQPVGGAPTIGRVKVVGPKELHIEAQREALQFSYRGQTETIGEGEAYRGILDATEDGAKRTGVVKPARPRNTFLFLAIAGGAAAAGVMIHENHGHPRMESPDRP